MKCLKLLAICIVTIFRACSDHDHQDYDYMDTGEIIEADYRKCYCCGGLVINIGDEKYRFAKIPENSSLNLVDAEFPIFVKLDWKTDQDACLGDEIIVERIEKSIDF